MLRHLSIRDYVLVDSLELAFQQGMTVLTGETGAGKSILVDALSLVLGDRAESGVVRQGAKRAEISAEFDISGLSQANRWLQESGLESDPGQCLLRRVVEAEGRSRAFINGTMVTLAQLREMGEHLVDIHGQHAHHALLKSGVQRELLDAYADANLEASATEAAWRDWAEAGRRLQIAKAEAGSRLLEKEGLESAIAEAKPLLDDLRTWDDLQLEHQRQAHMASLIETSAQLLAGIENDETGALRQLNQLRALLLDMVAQDASLKDVSTLLDASLNNLEEMRHEMVRYADRLSLEPERLADLDHRMAEVLRVSRKYHQRPAELLDSVAEWQLRLKQLDGEQDVEALEHAVKLAEEAFRAKAAQLSRKRVRAAALLGEAVTKAMSELALNDGRFAVALRPADPSAHGTEAVQFQVASHASLELGPLDAVASGGELSRVSLAIQAVLSGQAKVPTMIFDEVDVGIGGRVAEAVGRRLAQLASSRQVLVVTHLPQVAAFGHQHFRVSKLAGTDTVISHVEPLQGEERVSEMARMLGGQHITETTLSHAREMLLTAGSDKPGKGRKRSA